MDSQDERYASVAAEYRPALERLARAYEADPDRRRDLIQEIHFALWRSLVAFDGRCSLRTWVYRVAHSDDAPNPEEALGEHQALSRLMAMIRALKPPDAQVMLLYLEDIDAAAIGEITGMSAGAVAIKIHRIKSVLAKRFQDRGASP